MTSRRWALASMACAALVLAACSNSPAPAKHVTTSTHRTAPSSSTTSTSAPPTTTTTAGASTAACNDVSATAGGSQGAAGTITGVVTITNNASAPCKVNGYPTVALVSGSGAPLTVTVVDGLSVTVTPPAANAAPVTVTLPPSGTAQFAFQYSDVPVGAQTSCPSSEAASVTLPGATTASPRFALAIAPCNNGTVRVSPLYAL